jgi:carbamoyl-phosphate synthase large subunit
MTDLEMADQTYIEPLSLAYIKDIIVKERPDALLPTIGGQTALNLAIELHKAGVLKEYGVELIGAKIDAIQKAESREKFKEVLTRTGVDFPRCGYARSLDEAQTIIETIGFPCVIRPSYTLGGTGASVAYNRDEFVAEISRGLEASPVGEILIDESVHGWKEYELEVIRDCKDNVVIVCGIENLDPMGVHTGDSITVAPIQTLTDHEYQIMRDSAIRIIREVGVDTGGCNIQFAVDPRTGRQVAIEMNPRVSRSSALASKATGFPIAKIAAKLAVGYTLDEIPNDITKKTPACFEPSIDYVVTKIPRFAFDKFPRTSRKLSPSMKSVGEVMAIGRTFKESLQKALRSLEVGLWGFNPVLERRRLRNQETWVDGIRNYIKEGKPDRLLWIAQGLREGLTASDVCQSTQIDPWFIHQIQEIIEEEKVISQWKNKLEEVPTASVFKWKRMGFSDEALAHYLKSDHDSVRNRRRNWVFCQGIK